MLSDILATLIAFFTVILLLSVVVTAAVQVTQSVLRLRGRNLERGLTVVFQSVTGNDIREAKYDATALLHNQDTALLTKRKNQTGLLSLLLGPPVSWLDPEALKQSLDNCAAKLNDDEKKDFSKRFEQLQAPLQKRFLRTIRLWTIGWGVVVAIYFQVSTPALLNELWNNNERRDLIAQTAPTILSETNTSLNTLAKYEDVSAKALKQLAEKYPTLSNKLEEASGNGKDKSSVIEELSIVLEGEKNKQQVLDDYGKLLDQLRKEQLDSALAIIRTTNDRLSQFGLEPWSNGIEFYRDENGLRWGNCIGVLITVVLLSFGAPFWFDLLKDMLRLRDALEPTQGKKKPKKKKPKKKPQSQETADSSAQEITDSST